MATADATLREDHRASREVPMLRYRQTHKGQIRVVSIDADALPSCSGELVRGVVLSADAYDQN